MGNADLPIRSRDGLLRLRIVPLHEAEPRPERRYVLYWMHQQRRLQRNLALQHAVHRCREHGRGLVILEDLLCEQRWNGDRHFAFAAEGMLEHRAQLEESAVRYVPAVARTRADLEDLLDRLVAEAVEVVTDDIPTYLVPGLNRDLATLGARHDCRVTAIDGNGLLPTRMLVEPTPTAAVFRGYLHKHAAAAWDGLPKPRPLDRFDLPAPRLPAGVRGHAADGTRWLGRFARSPDAALADLPIDHGPFRIEGEGGRKRGLRRLRRFVDTGLGLYEQRNQPSQPAASRLSAYLHWGHVGTADIADAVARSDDAWDPDRIPKRGGRREGFWPLALPAQLFFDELLTWREVCHHTAQLLPHSTEYRSLPPWARATLAKHAGDERESVYDLETLTAAATHEELWNAAQRQLVETGIIHNYMRMLWGKGVLAWTRSPEEAFEHLVELNNRWALDGRNANSYGGIMWCLGRYDRPWQERPVFGTVRFMSPAATRRKLDLTRYLEEFGDERQARLALA